MLRILIADDHPLFRDAIKDMIGQLFRQRGCGVSCVEATQSSEVLAAADQAEDLDLVLLDLWMPGAQGLSTLVALRAQVPATPIVVISSLDDCGTVRQVMACGAAGFIPKSSPKDVIAAALETILAGGAYQPPASLDDAEPRGARTGAGEDGADNALTSRQLAVLDLLARGMSNKSIARALDISEMTVKAHVTAVLRKLGVASRAQAIATFRGQPVA